MTLEGLIGKFRWRNLVRFCLIGGLLVSLLMLTSTSYPQARGTLTGLVCFAPTNATSCSATIGGGQVGSQLAIFVMIQGSDSVSAFDITLKSVDHTTLKPADAYVDGNSTLFGGLVVEKCIGGVLKSGSTCASTDNADTVHLAYSGPFGFFTSAPTSGVLFTAVFNVTGTTNSVVDFQTGCSPTSVSGTTDCVTMANGSIIPPPETIQSATVLMPDFSVTTSSNHLNVQQFGGSTSSTISVGSINNYTGSVSLSASLPSGFTASFNNSQIGLEADGSNSSLLTITVTSELVSVGNYTITVTGSSTSETLVHTMQILVAVNNFLPFSVSPNVLDIPRGGAGSSTIAVRSENGYFGTVTFAIQGVLPSCISYNYNPATVQLSSYGTASSTVTFNPSLSCTSSSILVDLQSSSGTTTWVTGLTLNVTDFSVSASLPATAPIGTPATSTITVTFLNGYTGTVSLSDTVPSGLSCGRLSATSFTTSGTAILTCNSNTQGNYGVTITAASGSLSHSTTATFQITDFSLSANPTNPSVQHGNSGSVTLTVSAINGFTGTVTLSASAPSPSMNHGPTDSLSTTSITLTSSVQSATSTLTITAANNTPKQGYTITVTATSGGITHIQTITLTVT